MHNFNVSGNPSASQNVTNLNILEESCNNNSYSHWVNALGLYDTSGATFASFITGVNRVPPHWLLTNGNSSSVGFYVRRHGDWKYGSFDVVVHWSTSVASNNVYFGVKVDRYREVDIVIPGTSKATAVAAGAVDAIKMTRFVSSEVRIDSLVDRSCSGIYVHVSRDGGNVLDTNTGDVSIYGVDLIYNETKRVIGDIIKK